MKKPKANLYMLIKIEVDDDNFPNDDVIEVGWNRNKEDAIQKYVGEFCKKIMLYGLIFITMLRMKNCLLDRILGNIG